MRQLRLPVWRRQTSACDHSPPRRERAAQREMSSESQPDGPDEAGPSGSSAGAQTHMSQLNWLAQSEEQVRKSTHVPGWDGRPGSCWYV